jgi:hypothetical protein
MSSGEIVSAEVRWYDATGIGRREFKIPNSRIGLPGKRLLRNRINIGDRA